jgi:hypothetical protein
MNFFLLLLYYRIEIFNKRAKKYMEYYNDPSKLSLNKENKTGRDSHGSL